MVDSQYGFSIDTTVVRHIFSDTFDSYSFYVSKPTQDSTLLKNYVLTRFKDDNYAQLLVEYPVHWDNSMPTYDFENALLTLIDDYNLAFTRTVECDNPMDEILEYTPGYIYIHYCEIENHGPWETCNLPEDQQPWIEEVEGAWLVVGCRDSGGGGTDPDEGETPPSGGGTGDYGFPIIPLKEPTLIWQPIIDCINGPTIPGQTDNTTLPKEAFANAGLSISQWAQINQFLQNNLCSEEAQAFAIAAIDAINNGEVDFEENRINGIKLDNSLPPCLKSILLDLMLGNYPYSETMGDIELIEETFNSLGGSYAATPLEIVVSYKTEEISGNGRTEVESYDPSNQTITISVTIGENLVNNGTKLALVKTILHESIHAYLLKLKQEYPSYFGSSDEFSQLIQDYQNYTDDNDPEHIYMASIINEIANNVSNFVQEKYGYPQSSLDYYEAVCWSGITHLTDGSLNPLFSSNYPNTNDQQNIIKIFNTENGTASYPGYTPLINNNCN